MEISFYPFDFNYKVVAGKTYIYIYGKYQSTAGFEKICVVEEYAPYFYIKVNDIDTTKLEERLKKLHLHIKDEEFAIVTKWEEVEKELLGNKSKFWKIYVNFPKAVPPVSRELDSWGIDCYEKNIIYTHRYLRDREISPFCLTKIEGEFQADTKLKVRKFNATKISKSSDKVFEKEKIKFLAIDIETYNPDRTIDMERNPILMISFYGLDGNNNKFEKVITWKHFEHELDYLEIVNDEKHLIKKFKEIVEDYNPDIITGYFSDGFDFPYIQHRANKFKVKLDLGLDFTRLITTSYNESHGKAKINGILHLDIFKFIRYIFGGNLKTGSYSLDNVSKELLNSKKEEVELENLAKVWDYHPEKLEPFCKYNLQDSYLALELCKKLLYEMVEFSKTIGIPLYDVIRSRFSNLVENFILKNAIKLDVIAPNKPKNREVSQRQSETYEGAFVYEPTPGLYQDIIVFDFRSLYPTIITAHNIGPETLSCDCCKEKAKVPGMEKYWFCKDKKGFLPGLLEKLIVKRTEIKKLIKERKNENKETTILEANSYALKILANSFYGYMGFFGARWYCLECARSTTAYARDYIKDTIKKAEENGFTVCYGDTDSLFVLLGDQTIDDALKFMKTINKDLPGLMELEYEGHFTRGIFVATKSSATVGAKKKYALLSEEGWMKITGFEAVRRNWSALAKEVQQKVLELVLDDQKEEALDYVKDVIKTLKKNEVPLKKLMIRTQITRELSSYSSIGPHVAVAQQMVEKGLPVKPGTIVEYIITKGKGLIREKAKLYEDVKEGEYDPEYYLNHQIIPAVSAILLVLGYNESDYSSKVSQKGLSNFF